MEAMVRNARVGFRSLRRTPGFALTAALTLALGIGLSTAVFTVADALLIRRLPVRDQDRLVLLWGETPDGRFASFPFSWDDAHDFIHQSRALERTAYFAYEGAWRQTVQDGDRVSSLRRSAVSGDFFAVLGAQPIVGRALGAEDDVIGAAPVAVLSYPAWQQQFGGDPNVVGKRIALHDTRVTYTIVGVMPQGLDYPRGTDFWATVAGSTFAEGLKYRSYDLIGRLAPGVTPAAARDEVTGFFRRHAEPFMHSVRGVVHSLPRYILGDTKPALIAFAAAAALLLLITCINVANLLLVRGLARARELAVRSALGASRRELVSQLLVENALLAMLGGVVGMGVAAAAVRVFVVFAPADLPRLGEIHVNAAALAGAVGITGLAMMLFALAPAVVTSRVELQQMLRSGVRHSAGRRSRLTTEVLVAGQLALALMVLSAAGLVARSLVRLQRADLAFDASHLLVASLGIEMDRYATAASQNTLVQTIVDRLKATPGIVDVSPVVAEPFTQGWTTGQASADGQTPDQVVLNPVLEMELVTPGYFQTLGLPVIRGRAFTDADRRGAPAVVMLSESAARHYWPAGDAIGKRLHMGSEKDPAATVVGVVPDARYRDLRDAKPSIYFPFAQSDFPFAPTNLVIRTRGEPAATVPAVRRAVADAAPGVLVSSASPFDSYLEGPLSQPRFNALLLGVFATTAVTLAAVGLFGVMMTMVGQRTRELGIRMALGATAADIRALVVGRGLVIAAAGAAAGLLGALAANRVVASMLYEVSPADGLTLAVVAAFLLTVALLATVVPARWSSRIDPVMALRANE
jgi:predicted permease